MYVLKNYDITRKFLCGTNDRKWIFAFLYFQNKFNWPERKKNVIKIDSYAQKVNYFVLVNKKFPRLSNLTIFKGRCTQIALLQCLSPQLLVELLARWRWPHNLFLLFNMILKCKFYIYCWLGEK